MTNNFEFNKRLTSIGQYKGNQYEVDEKTFKFITMTNYEQVGEVLHTK